MPANPTRPTIAQLDSDARTTARNTASLAQNRWWKSRSSKDDAQRLDEAVSARMSALRDDALGQAADGPGPEAEPPSSAPTQRAELIFTAGPRAGERVTVARERIGFDRDANEITDDSGPRVALSVWAQGPHFMLRQQGGVTIGGQRPALSVVVLEDGDEVAWNIHRLQFRIETATSRA
jgi:hypothetical protein